ncbi:MAG: IS5/IS1182 family transposase, partial [Prevotella sp.]|nr:IS5/IS1182 family transposase [Prevotella sp.]
MDKPSIYRKPMGESLFEEEFTVEALSRMGNPLERLSSLVDFEMFRQILEDV